MGYGLHFPAHQVGGPAELWDITGYGFSQVWVKTGSTVQSRLMRNYCFGHFLTTTQGGWISQISLTVAPCLRLQSINLKVSTFKNHIMFSPDARKFNRSPVTSTTPSTRNPCRNILAEYSIRIIHGLCVDRPPWVFGKECCLWRAVCLSTPSLLGNLPRLYMNSAQYRDPQVLALLRISVALSRTMPLSFDLKRLTRWNKTGRHVPS